MAVTQVQTESEIQDCWPVIVQLRPHLDPTRFVSTVRAQFAEGYRLACVRHENKVAAVAGFRVLTSLSWGRFCYVDDLITDAQSRSHGFGAELLDWLCVFARAEGCARLELDSGVQRFDAHRFYLRHRMSITCHHFSLRLDGGSLSPKV